MMLLVLRSKTPVKGKVCTLARTPEEISVQIVPLNQHITAVLDVLHRKVIRGTIATLTLPMELVKVGGNRHV